MLKDGRVHTPDVILATDLDGTFLGGSDAERAALYEWIEDQRGRVGLIFVTGRDLPFIEQLCAGTAVPWPDYVIGDVGTTIAAVDARAGAIRPDHELERPIAELWADQGAWVREVLDGAPGLAPQKEPFRYRMSYDYDPAAFDPACLGPIEARGGLDVLISADRFLDVLPAGVSKGPSLLRLVESLDAAPDRMLVAGDTLNDLSLFETGLKGVAVGNSEPDLLARISGREGVYLAEGHGAAGVAQAIAHFFGTGPNS